MPKSSYAEVEVLKYLLTPGTMNTRPTAWYLGLYVGDPAASGSEVSGAGYTNYARQAVTFAAPTAGVAPAPSTTANTNAVAFPPLSGSGVTVSFFAVFDALTGGDLLYSGALGLAKSVASTESPTFAAGDLLCSEA